MNMLEIIEMRKKSFAEFEKYKSNENVGIKIPNVIQKGFNKFGKEILSTDTCKRLLEYRSIHYHNVVNEKLSDYSLPGWIVCLEEEILLEYAILICSRVLFHCPMLLGTNNEWEVLYLIAKIQDGFWQANREWKDYYKLLIGKAVNNDNSNAIPKEYLEVFKKFIQ